MGRDRERWGEIGRDRERWGEIGRDRERWGEIRTGVRVIIEGTHYRDNSRDTLGRCVTKGKKGGFVCTNGGKNIFIIYIIMN